MNNPSKDFLDAKKRIEACPLKGAVKGSREAMRDALDMPSSDRVRIERKESYYYHAKNDCWFTKPLDDTTRFVGVVTKEELQELIQLSDTREVGGVSTSNITPVNNEGFLIFYEGIGDANSVKSTSPLPGVYKFVKDYDYGIGIKSTTINTDKYVELYDEQIQEIVETIDVFMASKDKYKDIDMLHKRGILLYGPPGNGKSMLIKNIIKKYQDRARIFLFTGNVSIGQIGKLKEASSDMPTIFVFEEIVTHVESSASALLDFLDGESSWDNVLIIAATNYPEKLPRNFVDRPARFDSLYKFGSPTSQVVEEYLISKLGKDNVTEKLLDALAKEPTLSIAYLKELASAVIVFAKDPLKMINEFKKRKELVKKEFADEKKIGIGFGNRFQDQEDEI